MGTPIHLGEMLVYEFLKPTNKTIETFAEESEIPYFDLLDIVLGLDFDTKYLANLANATGTSVSMWKNMYAECKSKS